MLNREKLKNAGIVFFLAAAGAGMKFYFEGRSDGPYSPCCYSSSPAAAA